MGVRVRAWVLPAVAVVVLISGCSSSSSGSSAATSGSAAATSAAASTSASGSTSTSASAAGDVQGFCEQVKKQAALITGTELSSLLTGGTPAAWKAYFEKVSALNQQLVDAAPPEIQASVKTLQSSSAQLQAVLEQAGYDVSKVDSAKLLAAVQTPERTAASKDLVAFVAKNCKLDLTKLPG